MQIGVRKLKHSCFWLSKRRFNSWDEKLRNGPVYVGGTRHRDRVKGPAHPREQYKTSPKRSNRPQYGKGI